MSTQSLSLKKGQGKKLRASFFFCGQFDKLIWSYYLNMSSYKNNTELLIKYNIIFVPHLQKV